MKIYDCFMYNNEELPLDIRLNVLDKYVDKFILVESLIDHQGKKKTKILNLNNFGKFKNKISHLIIENFPSNFKPWDRENYQRNYITKGIEDLNSNDLVMISDIDEIPNLKKIKNFTEFKYFVFKQKNFSSKINLLNKTFPNWFGTKACKKKFLKSPQWLRDQKVKKYPFYKFYKIKWNIIENGGWHFSYLMPPAQIKDKLKSFAHSEFNSDYYTNIDSITKSIQNKDDILKRDQKYEKITFDYNFPKYIHENLTKFDEWII